MNSRQCFIIGIVLVALGSVAIAGFAAPQPKKPREKQTLTKEMLSQAIEKAKRGDKSDLSKIGDSLGKHEVIVSKELLPDFVSLLKEKGADFQSVGALGLIILKDPQSKEPLVEYIKSKDFRALDEKVRSHQMEGPQYMEEMQATSLAILALGAVGDKSVIPLLESLRGEKNLKLEWGGSPVHDALAQLGEEGIKSLTAPRPNGNGGSQEIMAAHKAISGIADPKQVSTLVATVRSKRAHPHLRSAAISALANMSRDSTETLPIVLSFIRDTELPAGLRGVAAHEAGGLNRMEVEQTLLEARNDPKSDPELHAACCLALAQLKPDLYFPDVPKGVMDMTLTLKARENLALGILNQIEGWKQTRDGKNYINIYGEMLEPCMRAVQADGSPADKIRVDIWEAYNQATGKEPQLEVNDFQQAESMLNGYLSMKLVRLNLRVAERNDLVNKKSN